ncbi:MAG TPA: HAD-IA family hydrolase [Gaiellaceae bacterium]
MDVEAVTIDAFGTLVTLRDPVPALRAALAARGVSRDARAVRRAFAAEVDYYVLRAHEGRDAATLAALRHDCASVFLAAAAAGELDAAAFPFVESLQFELVPNGRAACDDLSRAGLRLAVVSNWDIGLSEYLRALGLDLPVITSAEAGAAKPDPAVFELALHRLGTAARRTVHVGDSAADEEGARAAGLRFEPAPLAAAVRRILA